MPSALIRSLTRSKGCGAVLLVVIALLFTGCAYTSSYVVAPNPSNPISSVAVLPMYNVTNSLDGPVILREIFTEELRARQYNVMEVAEVNTILQERMGIVLGTQLEMTTAQVIGEILGVDALVFGYLLDFEDVLLGIYNARVVRAGFKMVEVKSGDVVWSGGHGVKTLIVSGDAGVVAAIVKEVSDSLNGLESFTSIKGIEEIEGLDEGFEIIPIVVEKIEDAALLTLGTLFLGKALGVHLHIEAGMVVSEAIETMPAGPGN